MEPSQIWSERPAQDAMTEAYPVGNGHLGAMVFGGTNRERLVLCQDTLYAGGPYDPNRPGAHVELGAIRDLVFKGQSGAARRLIDEKFMAEPLRQMPYQTLGNLELDFSLEGEVTEYRRWLDLAEATTVTTFSVAGIEYRREVFASNPAGVIAIRLSASRKRSITVRVGLSTPHLRFDHGMEGDVLEMTGENGAAEGIPGQLRWAAHAEVRAKGGIRRTGQDSVSIENADEVVILVALSTSYVNYQDVSGDPIAENLAALAKQRKRSFAQIRQMHVADYGRFAKRFELKLTEDGDMDLPTQARVKRFSEGHPDAGLVALYVRFARYLLISCSRPGSQPANLQGLWVDSLSPAWGSKYTININTEMNYWLAEPMNLAECAAPLHAMVQDLAVTGQRSARELYDAPGWVTHHNTDLWRATAPIDGAFWGMWPMGGAWLCAHLWDRYDFSRNLDDLRAAYTTMREAARFFLSALVVDPRTGYLVTCPSISPENTIPGPDGSSIVAGPEMDNAILRDLFDRTAEASELLNRDPELRQEIRAARARLSPQQIGKAGQLQEWAEDWDLEAPERTHRHVSHLFGLHPSHQISPLATPELATAVRKTLELRGDDGTGWSLAWKINFWARLHDAKKTERLVRMLLSPERTYPNFFDAHPPFQIDGNFGGANGVLEAIVQSHLPVTTEKPKDGPCLVHLLPALPSEWSSGSVRGVRLRGGFSLDMAWEAGRIASCTLRGRGRVRVRYPDPVTDEPVERWVRVNGRAELLD